jgi:hypothetical protein
MGRNRPLVDLVAIEEEEFPAMGESILKPSNTPGTRREGSERSSFSKT